MPDGYEYEVFVSYSRKKLWPEWIENTFMPLFEHHLNNEIPNAKIFIDYEMETGCNWPAKLAEGLSRSKILVGLWCKPYFASVWCLTELSLMCAREGGHGFNTQGNPQRLIVPASIHDGDDFPENAKEIQQAQLQKHSHVWVAEGSKTKEELSRIIQGWMPDVVTAIGVAPDYDDNFAALAYGEFMDTFRAESVDQLTVPNVGS